MGLRIWFCQPQFPHNCKPIAPHRPLSHRVNDEPLIAPLLWSSPLTGTRCRRLFPTLPPLVVRQAGERWVCRPLTTRDREFTS